MKVVINLTKNVTFNLPEFSKFVALKLLKCYRLTSLSVEKDKDRHVCYCYGFSYFQ